MNNPQKPRVITQPHGGALLSGGMPGNRGGYGRIRRETQAAARDGFDEGVRHLARIAVEMPERAPKHVNVIKAIELLGEYGYRPGDLEGNRTKIIAIVASAIAPYLIEDDLRRALTAVSEQFEAATDEVADPL